MAVLPSKGERFRRGTEEMATNDSFSGHHEMIDSGQLFVLLPCLLKLIRVLLEVILIWSFSTKTNDRKFKCENLGSNYTLLTNVLLHRAEGHQN